jgi:hypothetical protein
MSIATVIAQTHQGTGVISCHPSFILSVSASQYIFLSITVNQTSITIALSFNISNFKSPGLHVAIITISAFFV